MKLYQTKPKQAPVWLFRTLAPTEDKRAFHEENNPILLLNKLQFHPFPIVG
jgi:hypothetical protein